MLQAPTLLPAMIPGGPEHAALRWRVQRRANASVHMLMPPSTITMAPVVKLLWSDAK
jgi:hypothetical protein